MLIERFTVNRLQTNTYVVGMRGGSALVIDPSATDMSDVVDYIATHDLHVVALVNTHGHFDHVLGNASLKANLKVPIWMHEADIPLLADTPSAITPDEYLTDGQVLVIGNLRFTVLATPGHSLGGVCLYEPDAGIAFTGDTLFAGTIGRTDLYGGNLDTLLQSLREKLWTLPDQTILYPGHGEDSTIGDERMYNPWFHFST